jgi:small subunit ribosomal protein S21
MIEVILDVADRLDWALKQFKRKVQKAGVLKDLRKKRHYEKPSEVRQRKAAAARRRVTSDRTRKTKSTSGGSSKRST